MDLIPGIKNHAENLPYPIGWAAAHVPYSVRPGIGRVYLRRTEQIREYDIASDEARRDFILRRMQQIVSHAYDNVAFYRAHYDTHGFRPEHLKSFSDISHIPVVDKTLLQAVPIEQRSHPVTGRYLVNTGGSSGQPLSFYIMPSSIGHEWAHMHHIWARLGYRQSDLKLTFAGRYSGERFVHYDALRHHYAVNTYAAWADVASNLKCILRQHPVKYLHGYPSAIGDFAAYCESSDEELSVLLRMTLKGVFLGSEFPAPAYRERIHRAFECPTISWYGHTERAVLAWERESEFEYDPFQTYGYAETRKREDGADTLVGTSYYNTASPLIRYDTGDSVEILDQEAGILSRFQIAGGRSGDYVLDVNGKRIPLTALIFGRHHKVFDRARFVQVAQSSQGSLTVLVTAESAAFSDCSLCDFFDFEGVHMAFEYRLTSEPWTTPTGKVPLRLPATAQHDGEESASQSLEPST